ncbi:MAG: diguanylate cyclase domain-containing protein [Chloroflexota bacterium]
MTSTPAPSGHSHHDIAWLPLVGLQTALAGAITAAVSMVLWIVWRDSALIEVALVAAALAGWMVLASRRAMKGHEVRAVALMSVGVFAAMLFLLPVIPESSPMVALAALGPIFLAVPYLTPRQLLRYSIAVWAFSVAYVLAAALISAARSGGGYSASHLALNVVVSAFIIALSLLLLRQYHVADSDVRHLALHDGLTGLYNRTFFIDRLEHALAREERRPSRTAVLYLDLDGFKEVNDRYGHAAGDDVLRAVADRLRGGLRKTDTIARMGGDEFAVLIEGISDRAEATALAELVLERTAEPIALRDVTLSVPLSAGLACSGDGGETAAALLRNADHAMYEAKRGPRRDIVVYDSMTRVREADSRATNRSISGVIERHELRL